MLWSNDIGLILLHTGEAVPGYLLSRKLIDPEALLRREEEEEEWEELPPLPSQIGCPYTNLFRDRV